MNANYYVHTRLLRVLKSKIIFAVMICTMVDINYRKYLFKDEEVHTVKSLKVYG